MLAIKDAQITHFSNIARGNRRHRSLNDLFQQPHLAAILGATKMKQSREVLLRYPAMEGRLVRSYRKKSMRNFFDIGSLEIPQNTRVKVHIEWSKTSVIVRKFCDNILNMTEMKRLEFEAIEVCARKS